jgi:hypothetical protein
VAVKDKRGNYDDDNNKNNSSEALSSSTLTQTS